MPLEKNDWLWLSSFSGGAIALPLAQQPAAGSPEALALELEAVQNRERSEEQARKQVMIAAATARLEAQKEAMRAAFDLEVKVYAKEADRDAENAKTISLKTRDEGGDQRKAFDTKHHGAVMAGGPDAEKYNNAQQFMVMIVRETNDLAKARTNRSYIDPEAGKIAMRSDPLFEAREISEEIYTPMVREKIIGENFVPNKYSATQRMLDGSNQHYIDECKTSGTRIGFARGEIASATIELAATATTTVLSALAPVPDGQQAIAGAGKLTKEGAARAGEITRGVSALLTTTIALSEEIEAFRNSGNYSDAGFKKIVNSIGMGVGRIVAGATGDNNLGLIITDSVAAATATVSIGPHILRWMKTSDPFPWSKVVDEFGSALESGLNAAGDQASSDVGAKLGIAAPTLAGGFKVLAKALEGRAHKAIARGDWTTALGLLKLAATQAAVRVPQGMVYNPDYNAQEEFADQIEAMQRTDTRVGMVDESTDAIDAVLDGSAGAERVGEALNAKTATRNSKADAEVDRLFEEKRKALEAEADALELTALEKQQAADLDAYQKSLDCLGSSNPTDAEHKSIAVLIRQIETDRAIWTAIVTISGGGVAVAQEFVPGLKVAGELIKFIANVKAAAERLKALLDWKDALRDADSAISPYASSIENMIRNQAEQMSHYSVQAAANAIKALVAAGELSPYAPAFKVAGAAVAMAASAEDLIYKAYQQAMLVKAWSMTQKALHNPDDRKLGLDAREINPTLAKYTLAFGALIEHDQVAITACGRIGLDRETLARTGDKVSEVKDFMQTLYKDDNVVVGQFDAVRGRTKVPQAALDPKTWSTSHLLWSEKDRLVGPNPPLVVAGLTRVQKFDAKGTPDYSGLTDAELELYDAALTDLVLALRIYTPVDGMGAGIVAIVDAVDLYASLAEARQRAIKYEMALRAQPPPLAA